MLTQARKMMYRARGFFDGQLGDEPFRLDPYHSKFWRKASRGNWEPETFSVLNAHLDKDHDYLDIGAWIGPTVLYGARKARHVWCFEPDPVAFRHLAWNIDLNGITNVSAFAAALSQDVGVARMASFGGEAGDSMTSLLNADGASGNDVLTLRFDQFSNSVDLSGVSLVKMDVEGAEFGVLPTLTPWLRDQKPALFLSTHGPFLDAETRSNRLRALAEELAFYAHCKTPDGQEIGHEALYSTADMDRFPSYLFHD